MAVDASKLKRRRGLGAPPTEGAPGIEAGAPQAERPLTVWSTAAIQPFAEGYVRQPEGPAESRAERPQPGVPAPTPFGEEASADPDGAGERGPAVKGEVATPAGRQRVAPPDAEPRVPFTTRIMASTKERLENACYHLRMKHQAFIDEAIRIHLEKQGF